MWLLYLSGQFSVPIAASQTFSGNADGKYNTLHTSNIRIFISFSFILRGWSSFSKFSFLLHLKNHHSKPVNLKFQLKQSSCFEYEAIWYIAVALTLLCKVNYGSHNLPHVFINTVQMEHFSAVKFAMGYEQNMSFFVIPKSKKRWHKVEKNQTGLF